MSFNSPTQHYVAHVGQATPLVSISPEAQVALVNNGSVVAALAILAFIAREARLAIQAMTH